MDQIVVSGGFDDIRAREVRFLQAAARLGAVHVWLWSDQAMQSVWGVPPKFPEAERRYVLEAIRFVQGLTLSNDVIDPDALPDIPGVRPDRWVMNLSEATGARQDFCRRRGLACHSIPETALGGLPEIIAQAPASSRKKVMVTGCYDWLHSGHVRFFEECATYGDLYVVVGHDDNIRLLKGAGHPLFKQDERRYLVSAIRFVTQALISTGHGWLDAEPEIRAIRPDIYAVNEDGDKPEKRAFCARNGIQYLVLKRTPKSGLPRRQSTDLRGF